MKIFSQSIRQVFLNSKTALCLSLSFVLATAPSLSFAVNITVNRTVNLRTEQNSKLTKVGRLAAGSIVSIPDEFAVRKNGSVNFDLTLNNWLARASTLGDNQPGLKNFAENKKDFFFPVKIVKAASGSKLGDKDSYMVALSYLHRKGSLLETTSDTPLMSSVVKPTADPDGTNVIAMEAGDSVSASDLVDSSSSNSNAVTAPISAANDFEGSAGCLKCQGQSQVSSLNPLAQGILANLNYKLEKPLSKIQRRTAGDARHVISNFERSCGMSFASFVPALRQEISYSSLKSAAPNALNSTLMLSLMTQESTGNCRASHREGAGTSVGLFQVNTAGSTYSLTNPVANARAALNTLESKYRSLSKDFDFSKMTEEDRMRVVISAYNGGEGWVTQAKSDLLEFNRRQGTNLDYNNWEDLRIFYFRHSLDRGTEYQAFGSVRGSQRKVSNTLSNLSYTENLVPRSQGQVVGSTVQATWAEMFNG